MPTVDREGLREALANEIADILLEGGSLSPKHFAGRLIAIPDLAPILAQADTAAQAVAENDRLRASLANSGNPCVYCNLPREDWSQCASGFPGCARADDAMLCPHVGAELETADKLETAQAEVARLSAEVERLRAALGPFAAAEAGSGTCCPDHAVICRGITFGHLRAARTALAAGQDKEGGKPSVPSTDAPAAAQEGKTP